MRAVVMDTSALVRLYVPDGPLPHGSEDAIDAALKAEAVLLIPELALAEAAQVLHKKTTAALLEAGEADEILASLMALPFDVVGHRELVGATLRIARDARVSVYDAVFLALALDRKADLISADDRLLAAHAALVRSPHPSPAP